MNYSSLQHSLDHNKRKVMMAKNYCFIIAHFHLRHRCIRSSNSGVRNNKCYDNCVVNCRCIFFSSLLCCLIDGCVRFLLRKALHDFLSEFIKVSCWQFLSDSKQVRLLLNLLMMMTMTILFFPMKNLILNVLVKKRKTFKFSSKV